MRSDSPPSDRLDAAYEILVIDETDELRDRLSAMMPQHQLHILRPDDRFACLEALVRQLPRLVVLDLQMPHHIGLNLLQDMRSLRSPVPVMVVATEANVGIAVEVMKAGAVDFFEWPIDVVAIAARARDILAEPALKAYPPPPTIGTDSVAPDPRDVLTRREMEVLMQVAAGASNKEIGRSLGISPRTVEVHRSRIMSKLGARNAAELVRIAVIELDV